MIQSLSGELKSKGYVEEHQKKIESSVDSIVEGLKHQESRTIEHLETAKSHHDTQ